MGSQVASIEIQAKAAGLAAQLREAQAKFGQFADNVDALFDGKKAKQKKGGGLFGKKGFLGGLGDVGKVAAGNLLATGVGKFAGALEQGADSAFSYNEHLTRLQILANSTPAAMAAFDASVRKTSEATGKSRIEVLDAAAAYVALTGDMTTATASTDTWARVAQATGSSVSDIAGAAAALTTNLHVTSGEMGDVFGAIASQGKVGAIEIKDLADQLSNVAPMWAQFKGGTGGQAAKDIGAALQVGKRGFGGDASETVTGLRDMLVGIVKNASKFEDAGVKIYDRDGKGKKSMRSVLDIVDGIGKSKLMNDPTFLEKTFGRDTGRRFFDEVHKGRDDLESMRTTVDGMAMINKDLGTYLASPAGRATVAFEKLRNVFADLFTPERIEKFAGILERILPAVGKVATFVADSVGAIDNFVNGDTKMMGDDVARGFVTQANSGDGSRDASGMTQEQRAVKTAKEMLALDPKSTDASDLARNLGATNGRGYTNVEAAKIGARKFLESEGFGVWDLAQEGKGTGLKGLTPQQAGIVGGAHQIKPKDIADAIVAGMKGLNITLDADGVKIADVTKKAAVHRHDVKK